MAIPLDNSSRALFTNRSTATTSRSAQAPVESVNSQPSVRQALGEGMKKAGESAHAFGSTLSVRFDEARKNSAREQVTQVRERIQMLKRMILLFGGSKALLRELKQLTGTLAAAAGVLKEGGSDNTAAGFLYSGTGASIDQHGVPATNAPPASSDDTTPDSDEQQEAQTLSAQAQSELADPQSSSEEEEEAPNSQPDTLATLAPAGSQQSQRHADAKLLAETLRELKALVAAAKAAQRKPDREGQKHLNEIDKHLEQVEQAIASLNAPTAPISAGISIHV